MPVKADTRSVGIQVSVRGIKIFSFARLIDVVIDVRTRSPWVCEP